MVRMVRIFVDLNLIAALVCLSNAESLEHERSVPPKPEPIPRLAITQTTYKAAVYNHQNIPPADIVETRQDGLREMRKNLDVYEQQAAAAGAQGVDILVFPEYGLFFGLQNIDLFLEDIPDPTTVTWNPCTEENRFPGSEVQHQLSCMARNNSLYLVAQMGDKKNCTSSPDCGFNGVYRYNTLVAFDPNGTLIARYHKKNLYFEDQLSYPPPTELVTFDTPFGRFAMFTCFDSLFYEPAVAVIEDYNVDSVAFPTMWVDTPPFLSSVQWQEAFAVGMKVNFLAANQAQGSGIYTPTGPVAYVGNYEGSQLLVATISSRPNTDPAPQVKPTINRTSSLGVYPSIAFGDIYNFVELSNGTSSKTVCQGTLCCQANYTLTQRNGEEYGLGVFSGVHTAVVRAGMEMCVVMKCDSIREWRCGQSPWDAASTFSRLVLTGTFTTDYVFPEVVVSSSAGRALSGPEEWQFADNVMTSDGGFSQPLMSASLLGRVYRDDSMPINTS